MTKIYDKYIKKSLNSKSGRGVPGMKWRDIAPYFKSNTKADALERRIAMKTMKEKTCKSCGKGTRNCEC